MNGSDVGKEPDEEARGLVGGVKRAEDLSSDALTLRSRSRTTSRPSSAVEASRGRAGAPEEGLVDVLGSKKRGGGVRATRGRDQGEMGTY